MERLLHYVWKNRLYKDANLTTTEGIPIFVIDPGIPNTDAGPDFFNAKIRIAGTVWAGSVELHVKASDWLRHHHDRDKAYDSVILHVVQQSDALLCRTTGEVIPQAILKVPDSVQANIDWLLNRDEAIPCFPRIGGFDRLHLSSWLESLLCERLERKTEHIFSLLERYDQDWNEVFYITLTRNFGFGTNSDAFEWLGQSLPYRCIQRQRNSNSQVEALLFGQAGALQEDGGDDYYSLLRREYLFLRKKYDLHGIEGNLFRNLRVRPSGFPHIKLAQLASVWQQYESLFSKLLEVRTPEEAEEYFHILPSEYWLTHYRLLQLSERKEKPLGKSSIRIILINTVVPLLFAYGQKNRLPEFCDRALSFLEKIPPESNSIVTLFTKAGIGVRNAGDTQALIQLKREYCEKKKCMFCRIGFRLVGEGLGGNGLGR